MTKSGKYSAQNNQWLMVCPDVDLPFSTHSSTDNQSNHSISLHKLRHPKTNVGAYFLISQEGSKISEVLKYDEQYRSWFINQSVQEDGGFHLVTEVDPLFMILPYLIKSQDGKFIPLDDIIHDEEFPSSNLVCKCVQPHQLSCIAEIKGDSEFKAYKYSAEKSMAWLKKKVNHVSNYLESSKVNVSGGAVAQGFVKNIKSNNNSKDDYLRYSFGLISDYLPVSIANELKQEMGIKDPVREKSASSEPPAKRIKVENELLEDYSKENNSKNANSSKTTAVTTGQKKLSKVNKTGMKSMSSFFSPKSK